MDMKLDIEFTWYQFVKQFCSEMYFSNWY